MQSLARNIHLLGVSKTQSVVDVTSSIGWKTSVISSFVLQRRDNFNREIIGIDWLMLDVSGLSLTKSIHLKRQL
jgi:glucose uptake protein GlcU